MAGTRPVPGPSPDTPKGAMTIPGPPDIWKTAPETRPALTPDQATPRVATITEESAPADSFLLSRGRIFAIICAYFEK